MQFEAVVRQDFIGKMECRSIEGRQSPLDWYQERRTCVRTDSCVEIRVNPAALLQDMREAVLVVECKLRESRRVPLACGERQAHVRVLERDRIRFRIHLWVATAVHWG